MKRPSIAQLGDRKSGALHRTLPMWVRRRNADGSATWRIYAPSRFGGALYAERTFGPATDRWVVAAALRFHRRVIWGRPVGDAPAAAAPQDIPPASVAASTEAQLNLF